MKWRRWLIDWPAALMSRLTVFGFLLLVAILAILLTAWLPPLIRRSL